jgi:DNA-binding NarL/FixJ family response regulator
MDTPALLHVDPNQEGLARVATIHRRYAPPSALTQFPSVTAARLALDAGAEFDLALISLDSDSPGGGLDFVRWIRREHPLGPPVFVLHTDLEPCLVVEAVEAGAEGLLPVCEDPEAFEKALAELFELHLSG